MPRAEVTSEERFKRVVKAAFAHRRKTLLNSLKSDSTLASAEGYQQALLAIGLDGRRRAETLSVEEFPALERSLP
jgi:16S rRNA (adenine1518-N6/adenine1519-N6)-dimethyltransferase